MPNQELTKDQVGETPPDEEGQIDYSQIILQEAYIGEIPYDTIIENIENQFNDYINIEDNHNYVSIFYDQLHTSYEAVNMDEEENHPVEIKEALDRIHDEFVTFLTKQFEERLTITIGMIESEDRNDEELEFIFRRLYEFFILNAKKNFKTVISEDIAPRLIGIEDDHIFFKKINELMILYSPLIKTIKPTDFIRMRGDLEILEMFNSGQVNGNFLRKYSPKFYQNDEFQVEVINYITMVSQFGKEIANASE